MSNDRVYGVAKKQWPLRRVVDRAQNFKSTQEMPDGWIEELLECGHIYKDSISSWSNLHKTNTTSRRCSECARALKKAGKL